VETPHGSEDEIEELSGRRAMKSLSQSIIVGHVLGVCMCGVLGWNLGPHKGQVLCILNFTSSPMKLLLTEFSQEFLRNRA